MPEATTAPRADRVIAIVVPSGAAGQRVDRIAADVSGLSRSYVQRLISAGGLTHDGRALRANATVLGGERLELVVPEPEPIALAPESIPLAVVYEDDDILIVDSLRGSSAPAPGHSGTLVHALLGRGRYGGIAGVQSGSSPADRDTAARSWSPSMTPRRRA
jgi:23S rRNA pseudouridine1911/1915/1917 synthase